MPACSSSQEWPCYRLWDVVWPTLYRRGSPCFASPHNHSWRCAFNCRSGPVFFFTITQCRDTCTWRRESTESGMVACPACWTFRQLMPEYELAQGQQTASARFSGLEIVSRAGFARRCQCHLPQPPRCRRFRDLSATQGRTHGLAFAAVCGVCVCGHVRSSAPDSSVTLKDLGQSICILKYPDVITDEPNWKPSSPSLLAKVDKAALFDLESGFNVVDEIELSGSWPSGIQRRKQPAGQYLAYALNMRPFALVQTCGSYFGRPRSRDQPRVMLLAALVGWRSQPSSQCAWCWSAPLGPPHLRAGSNQWAAPGETVWPQGIAVAWVIAV